MTLFKPRVGKVIFAQTTGGLSVIIPFFLVCCVFQCEMFGYKKAGLLPYVQVQVNLSTHEKQESTMKVLFIVFLCERSECTDKVEQ